MIIIDKTYFSDKPEYSWLGKKLDSSFKLAIGDASKIVYGFNGIGKSSFSNCLKLHNEINNFMFLDYETENQKYFGEAVKISPYIYEIEKICEEIKTEEEDVEFTSLSKKQGYTKTAASKGPLFLKMYSKAVPAGKHSSEIKISDAQYKTFISKYSSISPQLFFKLAQNLGTVSTSKAEIDNYEKDKWRELLTRIKEHVANPNTCPVCDTTEIDINSIIDKKISALSSCKSALVRAMEENGIPCDEKTIDLYIGLYGELSSNQDLLNDYIICGNSDLKHQELSLTIDRINKKKTVLSSLTTKRNDKYNQIKTYENRFKKDISRYLKVDTTSIVFDDVAREITISLDRDAQTYSTGERHILWFLVEIYSFLGSDCSVLVLDDPVSSLDLANLYKIAFEIIRNSSIANKTLLVFTHSSDLINVINSQYQDKLDVYYLEEYNAKIYCDEIKYKGSSIPNVIDTSYFSRMSPNIYDSLKKRDYEGMSSDEHKVYHYSINESFSIVDSSNLSNHILYKKIDSYSGIIKKDFYSDAFQKVLLMLSLRVWLEKALYELIPSSDAKRQNDFMASFTLQQKIAIINNSQGNYTNNLFVANNIDKESIISKKVMLNQNSHYYSQVMPFAYAINLSIDDIDKEIKEIKKIFGR